MLEKRGGHEDEVEWLKAVLDTTTPPVNTVDIPS